MADSILIPSRFNGPPDSGHGGYSAGLLALEIGGAAEVSLRAPPPLETPLALERREDGSAVATFEERTVLEGRPAAVEVELPEPVSLAQAEASRDRSLWDEGHPFPTCFACGTKRPDDDGLDLYPGPVAGRAGLYATPWTPAGDGELDPLWIWTALDCPSSAPVVAEPGSGRPVVLASLAIEPLAPGRAGEPHAIASWEIERDGRKRWAGVALWDGAGEPVACGRALWIELAPR